MQLVEGLEKLSTSDDRALAQDAQGALAGMCDNIFTGVKTAGENPLRVLVDLRESHRRTGEKLAASPEQTAEFLQKLATAVYVDDVLSTQVTKLSGEAQLAARRVQLLGREYAVNLMRGLFA
jgi:hypothetical protein